MAVQGDLRTMALGDLLQWAGHNHKTGLLELERNKIGKRIAFREGRIVACSSDDPPSRYGQFLISQGKITLEQLREALERQSGCKKNLGAIFEEMGLMTPEETTRMIAAKAEENIFGLFDWPDAQFRFDEEHAPDKWVIEVDLGVDDVLMHGLQRYDELCRIRGVFHGSGLLLGRTARAVPQEVAGGVMARRILDAVDGERTIAEILLHAHATEYLVIKFLFMLHERGIVEITGERKENIDFTTILDAPGEQRPAAIDTGVDRDMPLRDERPGDAECVQEGERIASTEDMSAAVAMAQRYLDEGRIDEALDLLNECYRDRPGDAYLRQLILRAESSFLEVARRMRLAPQRIPRLTVPRAEIPESTLQPDELFLISLLDGRSDVQSIVWTAPMREIEILRTLDALCRSGFVKMHEPAPADLVF